MLDQIQYKNLLMLILIKKMMIPQKLPNRCLLMRCKFSIYIVVLFLYLYCYNKSTKKHDGFYTIRQIAESFFVIIVKYRKGMNVYVFYKHLKLALLAPPWRQR